MSTLPIIIVPHPTLRQIAVEIVTPTQEIQTFSQNLLETLDKMIRQGLV
jgi:peptide deformylase